MAECGNMPDWQQQQQQHPYHPPQPGRTSAPTGAQNASTGHMFVSSISPPALDGMNLSTESRHQSSKHQSEPTGFVGRNYQPGGGGVAGSNCPTSSSLTSGVHMSALTGCVGHYGATSTRNAMMENLSSSMDPRMAPVSGMTEEVAHRNSQIQAFPGSANHPNPSSSVNVNSGNPMHGSTMVPQNSPVGSMSPGRQGPGFGACKAPCCNPESNIPYQHWEKFGHYHGPTSANVYRENIRQTGYPIDSRRFIPEMSLRKDCLEGKELETSFTVSEHRRNFPEYKYLRKDSMVARNYPSNGGNLVQNYPMQNYNFPNEYQKCPYSVKEYARRGNNGGAINPKSTAIFKYQEQQSVIAQQKYQHSKQIQYQNGSVMPTSGLQNTGASGTLQNSYYNGGQMPRELARDYSREYQQPEQQSVVANRMGQPSAANSHLHGSFQKYHQVYHQKIAMQRYSVENHLRAFSRIPGYQSHPKYQECVMRYRELLRLQQSVDYPNVLQEVPKIASPSNPAAAATAVPPINLQFDQNGILINSNYMSTGYPAIHAAINPIANTESADASGNGRLTGAANFERGNQFAEHTESPHGVVRDLNNQLHRNAVATMHENNPERYFIPGEKNSGGGGGAGGTSYEENDRRGTTASDKLDSIGVDEATMTRAERGGGTSCSGIVAGSNAETETARSETIEYKNSKDFADKPELDVRQFLANWDESEDEDTGVASMPDVNLSDSTAEQFEEAVFAGKPDENSTRQVNSDREMNGTATTKTTTEDQPENVVSVSATEAATVDSVDSIDSSRNEREVVSRNKIQCIRTDDGSDDIPTIHIVDSLVEGATSEMEKIQTVLGSLASAVLNPISISEGSCESVAKGETIVLFEQGHAGLSAKTLEFSVSPERGDGSAVVEGVIASLIDPPIVETTTAVVVDATEQDARKSKKNCENPGNDQPMERQTAASMDSPVASSYATNTGSVAAAAVSCSSKSNPEDSSSLPKQNSFTSDESHNPDDISLPDLQTSECTPISTTLNTPIHSDSEESASEHVSDLTTSTNPIEIIQNSPIISFTHSPIKIEPYEQLNDTRIARRNSEREHDSLDFDFDREVARRENEKYNETTEASEASVVEALEGAAGGDSGETMLLGEIRERVPESYDSEDNRADENESDVGFYRTTDPLVGTVAHISKTNEQQPEQRPAEAPESSESIGRIVTSDRLDSEKSPRILEREDEFDRSEDLEKLCDMSLDGSCMIPLIPSGEEECEEPRMPVLPMEGNCLTKILNDTLPIRDLEVLLQSEDEEKLDKPDDDMWVEVRYMDFEGHSPPDKAKNDSRVVKKAGVGSAQTRVEKSSTARSKPSYSEKIDDTSQTTSIPAKSQAYQSIPSPERETPGADRANASSSALSEKSTEKPKELGKRRPSRDEKQTETTEGGSSGALEKENPVGSDAKNITTKSFLTKHRDSNVEIQVANLNLKIHDNEAIGKDRNLAKSNNEECAGESVDAIEIKINLSRGDALARRNNRISEESLEKPPESSSSQSRETAVCRLGNKCCRRRRRSMPDGFENTKRSRRNADDERALFLQHCTARRIKSKNRHKVRKSMDDELLLLVGAERSRKETDVGDTAKTLSLPWPRFEPMPEIPGNSNSTDCHVREQESNKEKRTATMTTKCKSDSRTDKHARTVPSPSYNSSMENSSTLDFDNFDVAPHHSSDTDPEQGSSVNAARYGKGKWCHEDRERYINPTNYGASFDELAANLDAFEINLNTVPIYTTKDGRITYSPNRNYTYRALIMEARQREGYPPLRKLHYPRHLSSNHCQQLKMHKMRNDEERTEKKKKKKKKKKRRSVEHYHSSKSKRVDAGARAAARSKKPDSRRKETRLAPNLDHCHTERHTGGYAPKSRPNDALSACFKPESLKNLPMEAAAAAAVEPASRKIDVSRLLDDGTEISKDTATDRKDVCATNNVADSLASSRRFANDSVISNVFQGQQFEIATRSVAAKGNNCPRNSKFFRDSRISIEPSLPLPPPPPPPPTDNNLEKRAVCWDPIEQDCQTAMSDSGLESSTTYVEASNKSRKLQRWKMSFVGKAETNGAIYSNTTDNGYGAIDLSYDKTQEKPSRYLDDRPKSLPTVGEDERKEQLPDEAAFDETAIGENPFEKKSEEIFSTILEDKAGEKAERENPKNDLTLLTLDTFEPRRMSAIVKSLDLAITDQGSNVFKEARRENIEREKVRGSGRARIFQCDRELKSRDAQGLPRRASSDYVDSGQLKNLAFETPIEKEPSVLPEEEEEEEEEEEDDKIFDDTKNQNTRTTTNETVESFEAPCKDFLIDTSTSFSSCLKLRVPETVGDMFAAEVSQQLGDTSMTRFASESMDFKEIHPGTSNFQGNFSFSTQGIVSCCAIGDNANGNGDSFLSNVMENPTTVGDGCSIESSELRGESQSKNSQRAKDSHEKVPTLSFSGKIRDSRGKDSLSRSPPTHLIDGNSIRKLAIKTNASCLELSTGEDAPESISRVSSSEANEKKSREFDEEVSSHPKIPKMIIRNVVRASRPGTPVAVEEGGETRNPSKEERLFQVEMKVERKRENEEEEEEECKVPKMKIKLEDKQLPRMMTMIHQQEEPKSLEAPRGHETSRSFPKVKIKKVRRSSPPSRSSVTSEKHPLVGKLSRHSSETEMHLDFSENIDSSSSSYKFTLVEKSSPKAHHRSNSSSGSKVESSSSGSRSVEGSKHERIPKLTIKKQEVAVGRKSGYSPSGSSTKKRRSRSPGESSSKKRKGGTNGRHSSSSSSGGSGNKKEERRSQERRRTNSLENESSSSSNNNNNNNNTDSQSLSEKIPKVIIKRASPSAEFKCELSKVGRDAITKDSKWQPEVKLQRSRVLDCMAREPGSGKLALRILETSFDSREERAVEERVERTSRKNREWKRSVSDCCLEKSEPLSAGPPLGNGRRRSLDEQRSAVDERRISREEDNTFNAESWGKASRAPSTTRGTGRDEEEEKEETRSGRKNRSSSEEATKSQSTPTRDKSDANENEGSVIKLDSSDESQTTIEILPASPDNSQPELDLTSETSELAEVIDCGPMGKLYSDEAIPTQFELELEIVDNSTVDSLDVPIPSGDTSLEDDSTSTVENLHGLDSLEPYGRVDPDDESVATDIGCEKFTRVDRSIQPTVDAKKNLKTTLHADAKIVCCSDSLVNEVLAAKETLKRCLTKSKSVAALRPKPKPRPKTAAEKKQGSGFHFVGSSDNFVKTCKSDADERAGFHGDGKLCENLVAAASVVDKSARIEANDEKQNKYRKSRSNETRTTKEEAESGKSWKRSTPCCSTNVGATKTSASSPEKENSGGENSSTRVGISGKGAASHSLENVGKHRDGGQSTERSNVPQQQQPQTPKLPKIVDSSSKIKSYKIPKISRTRERNDSETSAKVDKRESPSPTIIMPVLEPQVHLNFELAGSDRDTSRSPPVITKQEERDIHSELPKKLEENLHSDKLECITKQDSEAVTFADIVSQLAYHEKATIRHRRYCTLCERWFPTAARHRRHLTGYQHRHTELTQRRTVHALFMLFTGKPCPRLLPASIVRTDCTPGEPTPLQIAVQDVAISLEVEEEEEEEDGASVKPKDASERND